MTDRLERLVNLVIALRETRLPMSAEEIRARVAGYGQSEHEAFRRMLERDKADLRALGVPIETAPIDLWEDRVGYRIDPARYDLESIDLDPDELTALALAVEATGLGERGAGALRKLGVAAGDPLPGPTTVALGYPVDAPHLDLLTTAQVTRSTVGFAYEPAGRRAERRTVDPHALVHRRGRWYLVGHDHAREARRAFRLDRIVGEVTVEAGPDAFAPPPEIGVDDVVPPLREEPELAEVLAAPDVAWLVARRAQGAGEPLEDGWVRFHIPVVEADDLVGWALELTPDVVVAGPPALRDRIVATLRRVVESGT